MACYFLVVISLLLCPKNSVADDTLKVIFVGKPESSKQQKLIEQTQQQLQSNLITISSQDSDEFYATLREEPESPYDLIIAVGTKVSNRLNEQSAGIPVISIFISSMGYKKSPSPQNTTIFIDQPASRYLTLIKEIIPRSKTVSLLYSDNSEPFYQQLLEAAKGKDLNINGLKISKENDVYRALDNVVQQSNVLLAIPDTTIYNRRTIKTIFLTSYQNEVPIIGFSSSYTKAGAISSIHSSIADISKQLAETIIYFIQNDHKLPVASYPRYFQLSTNSKVANSLDITIDESALLQQKIMDKNR